MPEQNIYDWIHQKQAPKVKEMGLGEALIYYLTRQKSGVNKLNTGPSNLMNILISDRLKELGLDMSALATMSEDKIRELAQSNLKK